MIFTLTNCFRFRNRYILLRRKIDVFTLTRLKKSGFDLEPDKNKMACAPSGKDSDQHGHPPSLISIR